MSRRFKAVVFDFDGLLVDTEVPEYEAWLSIFRSYGVDLPLSVWTLHIGGRLEGLDIYAHLEGLARKRIDRDEVRRQHRVAFDALFDDAVPLPGVEDYIACARERGLRIGVTSSSPRSWVSPKLEHIGLAGAFDTVVCPDDVGSANPDPASYLEALADLGVTSGGGVRLGGLAERRPRSKERGPSLRCRPRHHDARPLVRLCRHAHRVA